MIEFGKIKPSSGSIFISSRSESFKEEMEIRDTKLRSWLNFMGLPLYQVHASGHLMPHEIKNSVNIISPKKVTPIHTPDPELFKKFIKD